CTFSIVILLILILPPARSTLFPYTTLFRSCRNNPIATGKEYAALLRDVPRIQSMPVKVLRFISTTALGAIPGVGPIVGAVAGARSEEHTSELQSLAYLVCRLLLEKKNYTRR